LEGVHGAVVAHPVTALRHVARARRRAADGRALRVRGTGGTRAGAGLGHVAGAGGGATLHARELEDVGRAVVAHPVAALGDVARPRRGTTHRRALPVRGTRGARAGAGLGHVAGTGGRATLHARRLEGVGRAVVAHPVAALGDVARPRRGTTHRRGLPVRGTGGTRAGAGLGHVAGTGGRAALRAPGLGGGGLAAAAPRVAALGYAACP